MKFKLLCISLMVLAGPGASFAMGPTCNDAAVLALEISEELLPPDSLISQIAQDLMLVRIMYPEVATITVMRDWVPGEIFVHLTDDAWNDHQSGSYSGLDSLNSVYGVFAVEEYSIIKGFKLEFGSCYHPLVLAGIYSGAEGVEWARENSSTGDGDDIISSQVGYYTFKHGYGDCLSGCLYEHFWEFRVDGGSVTLLAEYDDHPSGVRDFPSTPDVVLNQNSPNPFNPVTSIRFSLSAAGEVRLCVYDLKGRAVRELFKGEKGAGQHEVVWRGRDNAGAVVPSGVYFYRLEAGERVVSKKMILLE